MLSGSVSNDSILCQTRRLADKSKIWNAATSDLPSILLRKIGIGHYGGDKEIRTLDPLRARQVLSQLSYIPIFYILFNLRFFIYLNLLISTIFSFPCEKSTCRLLILRKEVIQPHLPIRLPCYDFTPVTDPTFDCCSLKVSSQASGIANFHGVTGGVYKTRERIHRSILICDY